MFARNHRVDELLRKIASDVVSHLGFSDEFFFAHAQGDCGFVHGGTEEAKLVTGVDVHPGFKISLGERMRHCR